MAAGIAFITVFTRQTGTPKARTMWAEDGYVFLGCHTRGESPLDCLGEAYGGYLHVGPRLGAMLAWLAPPDVWSVAVTVAAAVLLAGAAWFVAASITAATRSPLAGLAAGVALALPYEAGLEVAGNLANGHWILLVAMIVVVIAAWLGQAPGRRALAFVSIAALSSSLTPIPAVLAGVGWLARRPGCSWLFGLTAAGSIVQAGVTLTLPRDPPLHAPIGLTDALRAFADKVVLAGPYGPHGWLPAWATSTLLAVIGALALAAWLRRRSAVPIVALAALVGAGLVAYVTSVIVNRWAGARYEYVPTVLVIEATIVGAALVGPTLAGGASAGRALLARAPLVVAAAVIAVGAATSYRLESRTSAGPDYQAEFAAAVEACVAGGPSVRVPISPRLSDRTWTVEVPCDRVGAVRE